MLRIYSISEEEVDVDCKAKEDNGEILLVIECWVEPQHGRIYQSEARYLEGLTYKELPETVSLKCLISI